MEIEQAKAFVSRMSRTGEIPSGLSIALDSIFISRHRRSIRQASQSTHFKRSWPRRQVLNHPRTTHAE